MSTLTESEHKDILTELQRLSQEDNKANLAVAMSADDEFAMWHPWLFLGWESLQFLKKFLTTPRKVVRTAKA